MQTTKRSGDILIEKNETIPNIGDLKWNDSHGNEKVAVTDTEKAVALEKFFTWVNTVENDDDFELLPSGIQDKATHIAMHELEIAVQDTVEKLAKLKVNKSPGLDLLHPRDLYETRKIIAYPLFLIYNKSISVAAIPSDWKLAKVIDIHKKERNQNEETTDQLV